ncbi:hypothetical protein DPMN_101894 [Dreissena polymorpha]|uniref:Tetratricopeptide repeat protein n=1 Tax=Dreissena polymorpha TaxID=45954 RepID=A0A9D4LIG7_DREPO|nr:hypothetical protein DPMN_101894 [Dreissena polymorpha]
MYRTITSDNYRERKSSIYYGHCTPTEWAISDVNPFFYYLTFLSNSKKEKQVKSFKKLIEYCKTNPTVDDSSDYFETALNMLGNTLERMDRKSEAWNTYKRSIAYAPHNNAAYWHLFRLLGRHLYSGASEK